MKKYISTITLQTKGAIKHNYRDSKGIETPRIRTAFPILQQISDTVEKGEEISVITIVVGGEENNENLRAFREELEELKNQKGFFYTQECILKEESEEVESILSLFLAITKKVSDGDRLYACITYGTKPIAMVTNMALHYAYRIKKDVLIEAVKYGMKDWNATEEPVGILYDTTALFYLDCLIDRISSMKLENPEEALRALIETEGV